ncbi:MAG: SOS response-associated peptidase family protein [Chitinophagales bacterium]|nr:SOS response-associated peptidase [Bacteroidota bacterium]MCB9043182.1 SOS response-associated peptidase [Chitinophagales bacterium]
MCGVFGQIDFSRKSNIADIDKILPALKNSPTGFFPNYNIWTGMSAWVITQDNINEMQLQSFGLSPFWAKKRMYLFNARAEGKLNAENSPTYQQQYGIWEMPSFRTAIRSRRCIIPVNYFIEGTVKEKLAKPFVIRLENREIFFLGAIYDTWINETTGEMMDTFAIITTPAGGILQTLPHHRSPVVLPDIAAIETWLSPKAERQTIEKYFQPYHFPHFEAVATEASLVKSKANLAEIIR